MDHEGKLSKANLHWTLKNLREPALCMHYQRWQVPGADGSPFPVRSIGNGKGSFLVPQRDTQGFLTAERLILRVRVRSVSACLREAI